MKIPKHIEKLIEKRAALASDLNAVDSELSEYIIANNLPLEDFDYLSGCEMYVNPWATGDGTLIVLLEGKTGGYAVDGLDITEERR